MICAHCKNNHQSVNDVRFCATRLGVLSIPADHGRKGDPYPPQSGRYADSETAKRAQEAADERDRIANRDAAITRLRAAGMSVEPAELDEQTPVLAEYVRTGTLPELKRARYAIEVDGVWKFYQVDKPTEGRWAGYTFVKVQASDDTYPVRDREARAVILEAIAANPEEALANYGRQIGSCGICGRTLTDPDSIERGIGPICAGNL